MKDLKKKRRSGFTLVEMVVVVSILGILAGLGFMKFDQVQVKARENADYVATTNLETAARLLINDKPDLEYLKDIDGDTELKELELQTLVEYKYITIEPKPQSEDGTFYIKVNKNTKEVMVELVSSDN